MYEAIGAGGLESISYDIAVDVAQIVAGTPGGAATAERIVAAAGLRARQPLDAASALHTETLLDGVQLLLLEVEGVPPDLLEPLLIRLGAMAEARGVPLIATVAPDQIDVALALLPAAAVLHCAPSDADRLGAVLAARREPVARLHDGMRDQETMRMRRFHEEVARIADSLSRLTRSELPERSASVRNDAMAFRMGTDTVETDAAEIRRVIRARRMRAEFFDGDLFADPAWDMLLDLFAAELEHRQISVSSLCIAAAVPPTTALRWIGTLNEAGLFDRRADPNDRRRAYIALSDAARRGMERYIAAVKRAGLSLV
ncbi:hypothetical protein CA234_18520 [Sphingomonas sp. ABOLE]|uniref:hypothetical protein n=1 Tax=Sphingomonas sp. ABOLE TaxID=1985878 RepID=UPI000F7D632F|nr:hypothetical protein [Sphingomonas sp. ABOLE]RSV36392.1 hypothetical protein CA234_18520 [Sphingomonas sp. ABOLE]